MKTKFLASLFVWALAATWTSAATAPVGESAPDFTLRDTDNKEISLQEHRGSFVVLEWVNPGCPFVQKFYNAGEMQRFQERAKNMDVVWLAINSTSPSNGDYMSGEETREYIKEKKVVAPWLVDEDGAVARAYGIARTPEMIVINPEGTIIYRGAIDSISSANPDDISRAENYVFAALEAAKDGKEVVRSQTRPYGCMIKL